MSAGAHLVQGREPLADAGRAPAVVPVAREERRRAAVDTAWFAATIDAVLRVERPRHLGELDEALPVVGRVPARRRPVAGRRAGQGGPPHRHLAGRLVADVALAGRRRRRFWAGTAKERAASRNPSKSVARLRSRMASAVRLGMQPGPGEGHGVRLVLVALLLGRRAAPGVADALDDVGHHRPVHGAAHGDALVGAAGDLDDLLAGGDLLPVAVAQVGVADDPLEVEVGDVGPEVGEAPGDVARCGR